jgi:F0F1-type ATP synthase membrane subunit a
VVRDIGKDEIMRHADLYTKVILTIIAVLLAWNTLGRFHVPAVHAQGTSAIYFVEPITADWMSKEFQTDLAMAINGASKGRQLITLIPFDQPGKYLAVYK